MINNNIIIAMVMSSIDTIQCIYLLCFAHCFTLRALHGLRISLIVYLMVFISDSTKLLSVNDIINVYLDTC